MNRIKQQTISNFVVPVLRNSSYKINTYLFNGHHYNQEAIERANDENELKESVQSNRSSIYPHEIKKAFDGLKCIAAHMRQEDEEKKVISENV
jgi:hypothetical protein